MKTLCCAALSLFLCAGPACAQGAPVPELKDVGLLHETVWHLYRWYLDEQDAAKLGGKDDVVFWVRQLEPKLDPGDKSLFGEVLIPDLDVDVVLKKSDYAIPELGQTVRSGRFKIVNVSRPCPKDRPEGYEEIRISYRALKDYEHSKMILARFPKEEILRRFSEAAAVAIKKYQSDNYGKAAREQDSGPACDKGEQDVYLAPLLEAANETWAFRKCGGLLVHFSTDSDLENEAVWKQGAIAAKVYNIAEQTVVSLDEVPGSNAYMTRDQVGRIIFNCMVLGRRLPAIPVAEKKGK